MHISAILYVINSDSLDHINFARKDIYKLANEDELRHITHIAILFN